MRWRFCKTGLVWFPGRKPRNAVTDNKRRSAMTEAVYKVVEIIGTSAESWEKAATMAVERASKTLRDLRVAEVVEQDLVITAGKVEAYRTKLKLSFKYEDGN
jgi:flavin-binding protein dodecin